MGEQTGDDWLHCDHCGQEIPALMIGHAVIWCKLCVENCTFGNPCRNTPEAVAQRQAIEAIVKIGESKS
jgi:hypothetical protein